ncbi:MAG: hypothetical protein QN134_02120 [Armatimonadota bacterium]|nr:hypothetical protein [Armatimonadota bacterium]
MLLRRILPVSLFSRYERWWARRHGLVELAPHSFVRLELHPHRGRAVRLQDGTVVRPGDLVGEIHVDSLKLIAYHEINPDPSRMGLLFGRGMAEGLRLVAQYLRDRPEFPVVAVRAVTLYWKGSERLGFEVHRIRNPLTRFGVSVWLKFLLWYSHPQGPRRTSGRERFREPREAWMSIRALFARYGTSSEEGRERHGS